MEKEKFAEIVWEARGTMYRVAKSILSGDADCEDAVSQAIVIAFSRLSALKKEEYAKTWLIRIEINECCRMYKSRKQEESLEHWQETRGHEFGAEEPLPEDYSDLYAALRELPADYRVALVLYYLDGFSIREIAEIQRATQGTVKSRLSRGRQKLKKLLTSREGGKLYGTN